MGPLLDTLKTRAESVSLRGHKLVVKLVPSLDGAVGRFFEPQAGRNVEPRIGLKSDRPDVDTWVTLCHELGHFASWADNRRPVGFAKIEERYGARMSKLSAHIINGAGGRDRKDPAVYQPLLAAAKATFPQDLSELERRMILDEERLAWCFAAKLVDAARFDRAALVATANKTLGWYFLNLDLDAVSWSPAECSKLDAVEVAYVEELVAR